MYFSFNSKATINGIVEVSIISTKVLHETNTKPGDSLSFVYGTTLWNKNIILIKVEMRHIPQQLQYSPENYKITTISGIHVFDHFHEDLDHFQEI